MCSAHSAVLQSAWFSFTEADANAGRPIPKESKLPIYVGKRTNCFGGNGRHVSDARRNTLRVARPRRPPDRVVIRRGPRGAHRGPRQLFAGPPSGAREL